MEVSEALKPSRAGILKLIVPKGISFKSALVL